VLANDIGGTVATKDEDATVRSPGEYTTTKTYANDLTIGTAISVSSAAASSQMGYHTTPPLAALMTVFNVRVGRWLPNPKLGPDNSLLRTAGPRVGVEYLAAELFSRANAASDYVYVSDGGHFENLGVYELISTRSQIIAHNEWPPSASGKDDPKIIMCENI
jgi:hypothetical protein